MLLALFRVVSPKYVTVHSSSDRRVHHAPGSCSCSAPAHARAAAAPAPPPPRPADTGAVAVRGQVDIQNLPQSAGTLEEAIASFSQSETLDEYGDQRRSDTPPPFQFAFEFELNLNHVSSCPPAVTPVLVFLNLNLNVDVWGWTGRRRSK